MKKILSLFFLGLLSFSVQAQSFSLPKTGLTPQDFIPDGYFLLQQATGDLNKDHLQDQAFILASNLEKTEGVVRDKRKLVILLQQPDGTLALSAIKNKFVMDKWEGGIWGDPLDSLTIKNGTLTLSFYGGSRNRWGMTYQFRLQNKHWYLIGYTNLTADNAELTSKKVDVNLSTGEVEITKTKEGKKTSDRTIKKIHPIQLSKLTKNRIKTLDVK